MKTKEHELSNLVMIVFVYFIKVELPKKSTFDTFCLRLLVLEVASKSDPPLLTKLSITF